MARLKRALIFVGIVWSIASAFLFLQFGLPQIINRLLAAGWIPSELALPTPVQTGPATACVSQSVAAVADAAALRQARYLSWKLGFQLGFAAAMANSGTADQSAL